MSETLRELYADNGASGDNERNAETGETRYSSVEWNPVYCVYGWAHLVIDDKCTRCGTERGRVS